MLTLIAQWAMIALFIFLLLYIICNKPTVAEPYKYRILELTPYTFEVQVLQVSFTGKLWWKKIKEEWVAVDTSGAPYGIKKRGDTFYYLDPKMSHFRTRGSAERKINELLGNEIVNNAIIHFIN